MPPASARSISPAFARRALLGTSWVVIVSIGSFACFGLLIGRSTGQRAAIEQAQIIASSIEPGPGGTLVPSITRILERSDRLLAVATLDAAGTLHTVYPERPAHRAALDKVRLALPRQHEDASAPNGAVPVSLEDPLTGERITAMGSIVSVNGTRFTDARRIAVLLCDDGSNRLWMMGTTVFAAPVATTGLLCVLSLTGWFRRRVASPLKDMASAMYDPARPYGRRRGDRPSAWRETSEIASLFDDLIHGLHQSDAERSRTTLEAQRSLAEREVEYERRLRRAQERAVTDELTQLRNRAFLEERLDDLFANARDSGQDLSAVLIDLDNFKSHNDAHGHQAGDQLLRFVGALLKGAIRPDDYAIRYGGDEFVLLLPGCDDLQAKTVAERILKLFGQYARRMGQASKVSLSAGVASIRSDASKTGRELIAQADAALYAAKRVGKNTVASGQSMTRSSAPREQRKPATAAS